MGKEGGQLVLASLTEAGGSQFMWPFSKHFVHTQSRGMHTVLKQKDISALAQAGVGGEEEREPQDQDSLVG